MQERTVPYPSTPARGSTITRSDASAVFVAKLGFNPLSRSLLAIHGYRDTRPSLDSALILRPDVFRRPCDKDVALAGYPAYFHQGLKP